MGSAVTAIVDGFSFQAFWFWLRACELLRHEPDVARVGFEVDEYTAFDDVAVEYNTPISDGAGRLVTAFYYSIKYSVDYGKEITAAALTDPKFINAQSISFLKRLHNAVQKMEANGKEHLFVLGAPWGFASGDPIRKLIDTHTGSLRLNILFDGTGPRGEMGAIRKGWCEHLGLTSEEELRPVLSRLRFELRTQPVDAHVRELSVLLSAAGLLPIKQSEPVVQYFPLAFEMRRSGEGWFSADDIRNHCGRQKLLRIDGVQPKRNVRRLGIRSFMRFADGLGEKVDHLLCVADEFEGRAPKSETTWAATVPSRVKEFLEKVVEAEGQCELHLHCFGSIAFLAGYLCEPGLGLSAAIVQRQYGRPPELWTVEIEGVAKEPHGWKFVVETLGEGKECAVAVGLTHDTGPSVIDYCRQSLPHVGRVVVATPIGSTSFTAVRSGTHAFALAEQLKGEVARVFTDRKGALNCFWAAPNGFAFYLGQVTRQLGPCRLYEFDAAERVYTVSLDVTPNHRLNSTN